MGDVARIEGREGGAGSDCEQEADRDEAGGAQTSAASSNCLLLQGASAWSISQWNT